MTVLLSTYAEFIARAEALGFMALSPLLPGFPSLGSETPANLWHTGLDTDPWSWKDRAAEEKRLAYGCLLGGYKGFVSQQMYPIFYAAFHPALSMPARWATGTINPRTWQIWQLFEKEGTLNISQVRQMLGVSRGQGVSEVDASIQQLQREYYLTVAGTDRKISSKGEFYGWPVIRYSRVMDWAPASWLESAGEWSEKEARDLILDDGVKMSKGVTRQNLMKKLSWR